MSDIDLPPEGRSATEALLAGTKTVVIGGGFGGARAAITARSLLGPEHEVTLIDRNRRLYLCGAMPLLIVGEREALASSRSLGTLANRGIRYLEAEVQALDLPGKTVATSMGTIEFDYLVIAAGAEYDWDAVPGAAQAYSFYNIETARRLRRRLNTFRKGKVVIAVSSVPYKCPPAPYEGAMVLDWHFRRRGVRSDVEIEVATPEPAPLPVAGPEAVSRVHRALARKRIGLRTDAGVKAVDASGREVEFSNGETTRADLVITIPAHVPAGLVQDSALIGQSGWVKVNPSTLETDSPGVFAIGDVNAVPMANGRGVPKAGAFASAGGETVGINIASAINGTRPTTFPGFGHCFIAFSGDTSAAVTGNFMAEGAPDVRLTSATARGMRSKERFERNWRRFRI
jgi:sulfide:quinone oxidoreductase